MMKLMGTLYHTNSLCIILVPEYSPQVIIVHSSTRYILVPAGTDSQLSTKIMVPHLSYTRTLQDTSTYDKRNRNKYTLIQQLMVFRKLHPDQNAFLSVHIKTRLSWTNEFMIKKARSDLVSTIPSFTLRWNWIFAMLREDLSPLGQD